MDDFLPALSVLLHFTMMSKAGRDYSTFALISSGKPDPATGGSQKLPRPVVQLGTRAGKNLPSEWAFPGWVQKRPSLKNYIRSMSTPQRGNHHPVNPKVSGATCVRPEEKKKSPSKFLVGEVGACLSLGWSHSISGRMAGMLAGS